MKAVATRKPSKSQRKSAVNASSWLRSLGLRTFFGSRPKTMRKGRYPFRIVVKQWLAWASFLIILVGVPMGWWLGYPQLFLENCQQRLVILLSKGGFSVKEIFVEGRRHIHQTEILKAIGLERGQPIFQQDLETIKNNLGKIDWIKTVEIQRHLPGHLYVRITERQPIALWQHHKNLFLVDREGVVIHNIQFEPFRHLPLVVGADAPIHAPKILILLEKFPKIRENLNFLTRVRQRRWDLTLYNSILVKLPQEKLEDALARLTILIEQKKINPEDVSVVDLRNPQQIVLRLSAAAAVRIKLKGKEA